MTLQNYNSSPEFIDIDTTSKQVSLGKSTVLAWEAVGKFPRAVRLSPTKRVWLREDINNWIISKHADRGLLNTEKQSEQRNINKLPTENESDGI